jgi:hypothetical protein
LKTRLAILILVTVVCAASCTGEIYPGADVIRGYFADEKESLMGFVDALEAEAGLTEVWCVPPGKIIGQSSSADEEYELSGDLFDTFSPHCVETQAAGAIIDPYGSAVVLEPAENGQHYIRIDILRLNTTQDRKQDCGWFSYLLDASPCDIPLEDGWVARYKWEDSNDLKKLYEVGSE